MRAKSKTYHLLFVEAGSGAGGSSHFLRYFLRYLDKETFKPSVLFYEQYNGPVIDKMRELGVEVFFLKTKGPESVKTKKTWIHNSSEDSRALAFLKMVLAILHLKSFSKFCYELLLKHIPQTVRLKTFLKEKDVDLIFLNNDLHYHIPSVIAARWARVPCICRKAGIGGGRIVKRLLHRWVAYFVAVSEAAKNDYAIERLPNDKIILCYGGVDLSRFKLMNGQKIKEQLGVSPKVILIGAIARIAPGKGQLELIEAIPQIIERCPYVKFMVVGDDIQGRGRLLHDLKLRAEALNVSEYMIFTGWRTDIPELLSAIDIFVHNPNTWLEALGIATLEAMAMAKPTVVTNNWGLAETTEDGVTGYVIPPNHLDSLVDAITDLALDVERIKRMGQKARERVETLFDIRKNVKATEEIFLRVLESHAH